MTQLESGPPRLLDGAGGPRLKQLLGQLSTRVGEVPTVQTQLRGLLDAVVGVARDLSLPVTLRRIAEAACTLADAEYGALAVIGADGHIGELIHVGAGADAAERIGRLPEGLGLIGKTLRAPGVVRVSEVRAYPERVGFPPGHPRFTTFLGVPILVRGAAFGNLYLGGKRGGAEFTREDEDLVGALAAAVGFAIENARRYQDAQRRQAWLAASAEITTELLSAADPEGALDLVARRARQVTSASLAAIVLRNGSAAPVVRVADGQCAEDLRGRVLVMESGELAEAIGTGRATIIPAGAACQVLGGGGCDDLTLRVMMILPLMAGGRSLGALVLGATSESAPFSALDLEMAAAFAGQAALTLELARVQRDRERLAVFSDRDRIARDLHDVVIQRLFATGLQLQRVARMVDGPPAGVLACAVAELDQTIADIRRTIFALASPTGDGMELRPEIQRIIQQAEHSLGIRPTVRVDGPVDCGVPAPIHAHLLAALREALSNIARHSRATHIDVLVRATSDDVLVEVRDNGVGPGGASVKGGLANLRRRALDLGGHMDFGPGDDGVGTTVSWRVPLVQPIPGLDVFGSPRRPGVPRP
jgi:signal transduction histidine kinase